MSEETEPKAKPIPENKTAEKQAQEIRRLRGYVAAFRLLADRTNELRMVARKIVAAEPLGMVGVDAYERRLLNWRMDLKTALDRIAEAEKRTEEKGP